MPPGVCIANLKPDITIWDKENKKFHMLDLTVPLERNIDVRHLEKSKKYAHFVTNISHLHTSLTVLAVSSTGNITADNKKRISTLQFLQAWHKANHIFEEHIMVKHLLLLSHMVVQE